MNVLNIIIRKAKENNGVITTQKIPLLSEYARNIDFQDTWDVILKIMDKLIV